MKRSTAGVPVLLLLGLLTTGCSKPVDTQADQAAMDFLGSNAVYVLSNPTKLEGWNFQRPDGSMASEAPIRLLDAGLAKELGKILLDGETYKVPARSGSFEKVVGYRVTRANQSVELYFSFGNDQMLVKYPGYTGQATTSTAGVTAAHERLVKLAQRAFGDYKPTK
ncbi:MAG TPA: hypothetical protein VH475_15895 [Tepidisphaeraceae bacterium]|jgi:hypothetical protein